MRDMLLFEVLVEGLGRNIEPLVGDDSALGEGIAISVRERDEHLAPVVRRLLLFGDIG